MAQVPRRLEGQVAVVTAATAGIGLGIAGERWRARVCRVCQCAHASCVERGARAALLCPLQHEER
jgi:NAD(P)-dependent dehydrogenase (short-subunit alcohol dehydrogenase family)